MSTGGRDLAGVLTSLEPNDVLFIDEIHRLSPVVEEYLYSAMEDYRIDIMIDKGPSARSIQIDLNPFTLVEMCIRDREKVELTSSVNISTSPIKMSLQRATMNAVSYTHLGKRQAYGRLSGEGTDIQSRLFLFYAGC